MSDYENLTGKIRRVLPNEGEDFEAMCKRIALANGQSEEDYYEGVLFDVHYERFMRLKRGGAYELWEVFDFVDKGDDDMFCQLNDLGDGSYSFITRFYNGGTHLSEMLNDALAELNKTEGKG